MPRKIACVGAGPAGLYFSIMTKLRDPRAEVTVFERNRPDVTHGWGVGWDDIVEDFRADDPATADAILRESFKWVGQVVAVKGQQPCRRPGRGYGIMRQALLDVLRERATELGVTLVYEHEITSLDDLPEADVVAATDGVGSLVRRAHASVFQPSVQPLQNKYVWLATPRVLDSFTWGFVPTEAGWLWCHAYGCSEDMSTFIVECAPDTWRALGLDTARSQESLRLLEGLFDHLLDGQPLLTHSTDEEPLPWVTFRLLTNERWYADNVVLIGDAAHTTHFSIGSGTKLAMADAVALADSLHEHDDVPTALAAYQHRRQVGMVRPSREARLSAAWFENVPRYAGLDAARLHASLVNRRSRIVPLVPPRLYYGVHRTKRLPVVRTLYQQAARRLDEAERNRLAGSRPLSGESSGTGDKAGTGDKG